MSTIHHIITENQKEIPVPVPRGIVLAWCLLIT